MPSTSPPTSRKRRSRGCGPASRSRSRSMRCPSTRSRARSKASRRPPAPSSRCCRRTTPPATSPRSCSACRCASTSPPALPARGCCARACPWWSASTPRQARLPTGARRCRSRKRPDRARARSMTSAATTLPGGPSSLAPSAAERVDPIRVVAFLAMCFGMFMAILDIQVVSASLAEIQAGLAASSDEITWVQTAYLMAEVVAIPLSGFLSRALGTRLMFAGAAAGFTIASLMCGLTSSMSEMIVWRALQGFIGGGMVPTVFSSAYTIFPRSRMPVVVPMIGLIATLAPTVGPTIGGYLTDALSWHWLFFINIVPGIVVTIAAITLIDFDKPDFALFKAFDWVGLISMASFLGALEYVLEDGPRYDWFDDSTIALMAVVSAVSALVFLARVLSAKNPIVDLRAFLNRNFALG